MLMDLVLGVQSEGLDSAQFALEMWFSYITTCTTSTKKMVLVTDKLTNGSADIAHKH